MLRLLNNIKRYERAILIAICLLSFLIAQETYSISGIVLDSETEKPISNVNVYIEDSNAGTTTDYNGYFKLSLNNQLENSAILNIKMNAISTLFN